MGLGGAVKGVSDLALPGAGMCASTLHHPCPSLDRFEGRELSAEREADWDQDPAFHRVAVAALGRDKAPSFAHGVERGSIEVIEAGRLGDFDSRH